MGRSLAGSIGFLIGAAVGYPLSFFFQNELVRAKLGMGGYLEHFVDVLKTIGDKQGSELGWTALITMLVCGLLGQLVLTLAAGRSKS